MRTEPPMSLPEAKAVVPAARAALDPPDEPPGVNSGFQGLRVTPCSRDQQTPEQENSGVAVRAWTIAPDSISRAMAGVVLVATKSLLKSDPLVVILPLIQDSSFTASGRPSKARGVSLPL